MIFFRKFKSTEVLEKEKQQLWNDYQTCVKVENSDDLKEYLSLKEKVESKPFVEKKKEIEGLRFKDSPQYHLLRKFDKIKNNRNLLRYFSFKSSPQFARFIEIEKSGILEKLSELERYIKLGQFAAERKSYKQRRKIDKANAPLWEETEAFAKNKEYDELRTSVEVIFFLKLKKSGDYKNYKKIENSALLNQYEDISTEIASDKFKERKAYLEDVKRYDKTDDFKLLDRYKQLDLNPDIHLYLRYNDTDAFKFFREWTAVYTDDFSQALSENWSFITPVAQQGPGKNFSVSGQLQYYNNSDNFDSENGILTLETKKEQVEGLLWDKQYGFIPKIFNYASGVAHTLDYHKQQYGYFEIKVKSSKVKGVISSLTLTDEMEELAIRVYSAEAGHISGGVITTDHNDKKINKVRLKAPSRGYVIVSLSWTPEKIEWWVNDRYMGAIAENIPHVPLGLRIETEVLKETSNLPHRLDVDWIKCYKKA